MTKVDAQPGEFFTTPAHFKFTEMEFAAINDFFAKWRAHNLYQDGSSFLALQVAYKNIPQEFRNARKT